MAENEINGWSGRQRMVIELGWANSSVTREISFAIVEDSFGNCRVSVSSIVILFRLRYRNYGIRNIL